jgi:uncharacterized protein (TIGR02594 family)
LRVFAYLLVAVLGFATVTPAKAELLAQAQKYNGLHESKNNKALRSMLGVNPRSTPWCGYFLNMVATKAGRNPPKSFALAKSWRTFGYAVPIKEAKPGDVVVVRTGKRYHAGILKKLSGKTAQILGGNQSNRIQVSNFSRKQIVSVRR